MTTRRWIFFLITIAVGIGLGLLYGWVLSPLEYVDTSPDTLRADFKTDYTLMVAEIYQAELNTDAAARRLALLGSEHPLNIISAAIEYARSVSYSPQDIALLQSFQLAMQTWQPSGTQP